jgi:Bacteriophage T4 gp9/10-like protein
MSQQTINVGTVANDGTGDTIRAAMNKTNANFTELYSNVSQTISVSQLKSIVALSSDFADFKTRIAAL